MVGRFGGDQETKTLKRLTSSTSSPFFPEIIAIILAYLTLPFVKNVIFKINS